jgi:hypothetical protein
MRLLNISELKRYMTNKLGEITSVQAPKESTRTEQGTSNSLLSQKLRKPVNLATPQLPVQVSEQNGPTLKWVFNWPSLGKVVAWVDIETGTINDAHWYDGKSSIFYNGEEYVLVDDGHTRY